MIKDKIKTGIPGLDEMLDGGLIPGRTYIVSGASGTGKTTLAMQFLIEGATHGERALYIALDEPPNEVKKNMMNLGWDISSIQVFDATPDVMSYDKTPVRDVSTERAVTYFKEIPDKIRVTSDKSPSDVSINTVQEMLKQEMKVRKYTRVVVDSLTSLRYFYIKTSEENASMISFFRLLSDLGVTTLATVQLPEIAKPDVEAHMARGEISLHKWLDGRGLARGVTIEKFRGSCHDSQLRTMKITSDGVTVKQSSLEKESEDRLKESGSSRHPERSAAQPPVPVPESTHPPALPSPDPSSQEPGVKSD
jgi:KaiC/GvpD/RAD55 family RecA-like ATPase